MEYHLNLNVQSFSELSDTARQLLSAHPSDPVKIRDAIYFRVGDQVYSCRDCPESRELITRLVSSDSGKVISSEDAVWKSALNGIADPALYEEYRLRDRMCRTVVLFRPMQRMERFALQNNIPLESSDRLISMDNGDVALILHMNERSEYEPFEYAEAVTETMESEAGIVCCAGIGRPVSTADMLPDSYQEVAQLEWKPGSVRTGSFWQVTFHTSQDGLQGPVIVYLTDDGTVIGLGERE